MSDLLIYALTAGLVLALVCGPLGALIVWQRLAYFGDTLAHSALLGVALGLLLNLPIPVAVIITSLAIALLLWLLQRRINIGADTLLGLLSHSSLALGLLVLALSQTRGGISIESLLFGDLLAIRPLDLTLIIGTCALVGGFVWRYWNALVSITTNADLAAVEGVPVERLRLLLMLAIALVIAISIKIVGVLLITALLIIPAASASQIAASPEQVAARGSLLAATAVIVGLTASWIIDTPAGATIVSVAALFFLLLYAAGRLRS